MKQIRISTDKNLSRVKPLHGVGGGPVTDHWQYDATQYFRDAGIPFSRTHDIEYPFGAGEYVDIHCIFPDFRRDENDPSNYNFVMTDAYLKAIAAAGTETFYRLGSSIEHQPIKRYILPPTDFAKWGRVCSRIIAHYNEGWGDGLHLGIRYWEIWNEPDLENRCWTGTHEQMFELYDAAATIIKAEHPDVKVGGMAFTSPYSPMCEEWLKHLNESHAPIDFFSWHLYMHTPQQATDASAKAQELMEKYGFGDIESIFDEWNYVVAWDDTIARSLDMHKTAMHAAYCAGVLCELQKSRTDISTFYDAQMLQPTWQSFFSPKPMHIHGEPKGLTLERPYFAFWSWNKLYELKTAAAAQSDCPDVFVSAACADGKLRAIVSYYNDEAGFGDSKPAADTVTFAVPAFRSAKAFICDEAHVFDEVKFDGITLPMDGNSFAYIEWEVE